MLASAFEKVMSKFFEEDVKLVIRLNDELYDRDHFTQNQMEHGECFSASAPKTALTLHSGHVFR